MEAVRPGWLYPLRPYITHVNTFHVPTVEFTLLQTFLKGTQFTKIAPIVFQDTLEKTVNYLVLGGHFTYLGADGVTDEPHMLGEFIKRSSVPSIEFTIPAGDIIWTPRRIGQVLLERPSADYSVLVALYLRVNGANSLSKRIGVSKHDVLHVKIAEFLQRHYALAKHVDTLEDPSDRYLVDVKAVMGITPVSGGPTDFKEDTDYIRVHRRIIPIEDTPLQVIQERRHEYLQGRTVLDVYGDRLIEFRLPVEQALATIAAKIRSTVNDAVLEYFFIDGENDAAAAFEHYYPVKMTDAAMCKAHSWYLACLIMINKAWTEVSAAAAAPVVGDNKNRRHLSSTAMPLTAYINGGDAMNRDPEDDDEHNGEYLHSLEVRHAFYRCMGSYVELMYESIGENKIADRYWKSELDATPSVFDRFFPADTTCFHWGDLPALDGLLEHVGLSGVQIVKTKIPIVRILMKSLPVCCQSRDLVKCFLRECRAMNGEGYWRVVRSMFFCTLCGLYPGSVKRVDFRSMMRIRHMLFKDRSTFFSALEQEIVDNRSRPKGKKKNRACQLVYIVFREYFIYLASRNSEWVKIVNHCIKWEQFVISTLKSADVMRSRARFADSPVGNEFQHAIKALHDCKDKYELDVYRYRKKEYVQTLLEKFNSTQDNLHTSQKEDERDIVVIRELLDRIVDQEILDEIDIAPLNYTRQVKTMFRSDPLGFYQMSDGVPWREGSDFHIALAAALNETERTCAGLQQEVSAEIKSNIFNFIMRTQEADWLKFEHLLDPRLGGVSRDAVLSMYKTRHVYDTRSSPKSIETNIVNLKIHDFRVFSWWFNIVSRISLFRRVVLDAETVEDQARAMRAHRFHLLPEEPLPPGAWTVYACICCGRLATFSDTATYGNFRISYDPVAKTMICGKKVSRVARARAKAAAKQQQQQQQQPETVRDAILMEEYQQQQQQQQQVRQQQQQQQVRQQPLTMAEEEAARQDLLKARMQQEEAARKKKARTERKDSNTITCVGQPVIPVVLYGCALEFNGERHQFCGGCGQLHTYRDSGWGRGGYRCPQCRAKETPAAKMRHCAFCSGTDRGHPLKVMEIIAPGEDPCASQVEIAIDADTGEPITECSHNPVEDPLQCYQTLYFCQKDANSAGLFATHYVNRHYVHMPKDDLWPTISPANSARQQKQFSKYK